MLKTGGNLNIFDRLYKKTPHDENISSQVNDNIQFLNKNCKFLSFAEKENAITLLKKRDTHLEATITDFKQNKISKDQLKNHFYAVLYPKRFSKRQNENINPLRPEDHTLKAKKSPENRDPKNHSQPTVLKAKVGPSTINTNTVHKKSDDLSTHNKEPQKRFDYNNLVAFRRPAFKTLRFIQRNTGLGTKPALHMDFSRHKNQGIFNTVDDNYRNSKKTTDHSDISQKSERYGENQLKIHSTTDVSDTRTVSPLDFSKPTGHAIHTGSGNESFLKTHDVSSYSGKQNGTPDLMVPEATAMRRPSRSRTTNEEAYKRGRIPSTSPVKHNNEDNKDNITSEPIKHPEIPIPFKEEVRVPVIVQHVKDLSGPKNLVLSQGIFERSRGNLYQSDASTEKSSLARSKGSDQFMSLKRSEVDSQFLNDSTLNTRLMNQFMNKEGSLSINSNIPNIYKESRPEILINIRKLSTTSHDNPRYTVHEEKRTTLTPVANSRGLKDPRGFDFTTVSSRAREVIENLITDKKTSEVLPSVTRKFTDPADMQMESPNFKTSDPNPALDIPEPVLKTPTNAHRSVRDFSEAIKTTTEQPTTQPPAPISLKLQENDKMPSFKATDESTEKTPSNAMIKGLRDIDTENLSMNLTQSNYNEKPLSSVSANVTPSRYEGGLISPLSRDAKSNLDNSHFFTSKAEKYVSVNLLKRVFEDNSICAEDIVDEIFRYLGEHIVNKNYFTQIMTNYLNCLPQQHGVKAKDIANKIFEICDRNGDGLISANDLGSRVTLFSKMRTHKTKEKMVYELLDPQGRGFVIETDIINALTKAQALACSKGAKVFDDHDEILEESKRIVRELDKGNKGIVTYWDVFLWKDTESFSDLAHKLSKYTTKLNAFSSIMRLNVSLYSQPETKDYISQTAQKLTSHSNIPFTTTFKPFSSVMQEPQDMSPINSRRYSRSRTFHEDDHPIVSYRKNTDTHLDYIRATADFSAAASNDKLHTKINPLNLSKHEAFQLQAGDNNNNSRTEYEKPMIDLLEGSSHDNVDYAFEKKTTKLEDRYGGKGLQLFNRKNLQTMADSETDGAMSTEIQSKKDTRTSKGDKEIHRYYEDFGFRESECYEKNSRGLSFV